MECNNEPTEHFYFPPIGSWLFRNPAQSGLEKAQPQTLLYICGFLLTCHGPVVFSSTKVNLKSRLSHTLTSNHALFMRKPKLGLALLAHLN